MTLKVIVRGKTRGIILVSKNPINFLGGVDKKTGRVRDEKHDLFGKILANKILVFPYGVGSSVGAYTIYSLKYNKCAPIAMICLRADLTTASGCAISNIPLLVAAKEEYESLKDGQEVLVDAMEGKIL
ncbi:MAG: aconitase X swivel domain-containing protein [Nitrosopumilaceae archaeon]